MSVRIRLQRPEDVKKEGILHVGDNNSQSAASAPGQGTRMKVGVILELGGGSHYASARGALYDAEIVQGAGYSGRGHARFLRHCFKADGDFWRLSALFRHIFSP